MAVSMPEVVALWVGLGSLPLLGANPLTSLNRGVRLGSTCRISTMYPTPSCFGLTNCSGAINYAQHYIPTFYFLEMCCDGNTLAFKMSNNHAWACPSTSRGRCGCAQLALPWSRVGIGEGHVGRTLVKRLRCVPMLSSWHREPRTRIGMHT